MSSLTFYAPTLIDMSMTRQDKRGHQKPTGDLSALVFTRTFVKRGENIKASRGMMSVSWTEDTPEAKAKALTKAIAGMDELPELDRNPPTNWIPKTVKEKLL